ncbi:hypothetical protein JCM10207_008203 [Rhodosporidiobolus poonsookiae]
MAEQTYKFEVKMTCSGCSGAVERALKRVEGITYDVSLADQTVIVKTASVPFEEVEAKIKKTGKEVLKGEVVA